MSIVHSVIDNHTGCVPERKDRNDRNEYCGRQPFVDLLTRRMLHQMQIQQHTHRDHPNETDPPHNECQQGEAVSPELGACELYLDRYRQPGDRWTHLQSDFFGVLANMFVSEPTEQCPSENVNCLKDEEEQDVSHEHDRATYSSPV